MTTSSMSTQTANQLKNGDQIRVTAETFPEDALEEAAKRLSDGSEPSAIADARANATAGVANIGRVMSTANKRLEEAERAYAAEQADDPPVRKARDDAAKEVGARWGDVKEQLTRRFGGGAPREYGLEGELPSNPDVLSTQAANAVKLLRVKPRTHANGLGEFSTTTAASYLEEPLLVLASSLTAVKTEAKELQDALGRRDAATAEWGDIYQASATLLEGYLRLGRRLDLAERVRPTARRAAGLEVPTPTPEPTPVEPTPMT